MTSKIFNFSKDIYNNKQLLLGKDAGLVDSIHKVYPTIWTLYKKLKSLDWDENEFDFSSCKKEFSGCDKNLYSIMIKTLAWQWEADSIANRAITGIGSGFTTNTELWALWQAIGLNETLHALTYSEIVRNSFDDPEVIINEILSTQESRDRLKVVIDVLDRVYIVSHKLALNIIDRDSDEAIDNALLYVSSLYILERIQFMASFAVTFAVAETGQFLPIGKAVQKICQDEYEIHSRADLEILRIELSTERGMKSLVRIKDNIKEMLVAVIESEKEWCDYAFSDGRQLPGLSADILFDFVLYNAKEVNTFFDFNLDYKFPDKNPLRFIDSWINLGLMQSSPQEEKHGNYMLGGIITTIADDEIIHIDL